MTRAVAIPQSSIVRAIKAVEKAGVPMVIEIARDGSLCIVPPSLAKRGAALTPAETKILDWDKEIVL
ncbi:hypothetical protein [Paremcibacter congregatus]|uniref:hypothetical protein n=1 Tax=Paremcibacter congregatus TaxID=2043170 RepID=UPI0030EC9D7C|tara:strand:+ start:1694 stop:1894 length:201 start_codon:yes stop_codon:yes gene_type:complete